MNHLIFLSVPGLRVKDVDRQNTPTLHGWAQSGGMTELTPTFPCVTSCVQASMWTGAPPGEHGVIANGFYHRDRGAVEFWVAQNDVVEGDQIWDVLKTQLPGATSAAWHAQNIKDAAADFIVTPAPIHEDDGSTKLWCYSKPDGLYQQLIDEMGHFSLQHYWGPLSNIESTRWILRAAGWLHERHAPNFHWIYIPHLDYASQKHGPDSPQALTALKELDQELAQFANGIADGQHSQGVNYLVASEYAMTDVSGVIYPNRMLREAGLLTIRNEEDKELIDLGKSKAFAMVDHQFAHVYTADARSAAEAAELFEQTPGIAGAYWGDKREEIGMTHPRCGEVVLVTEPTHWLAYYWWLNDAFAPAFARTVDIHAKPGYDPVELFFDPATKSIPLDATLVKGSHGAPANRANQRGAIICSHDSGKIGRQSIRDVDVRDFICDMIVQD